MSSHKGRPTLSTENGADDTPGPFAPRTLPFDILAYLLFYLPHTRDVSSMARTCRALLPPGAQEMLRRNPDLSCGDSERKLRSFLRFIAADNGARLSALQELDASVWQYSEKATIFDLLTDIVQRSLHLKVLRVRGIIFLLGIEGDKNLCEAISKLEYLEKLQLDIYTPPAAIAVAAALDLMPGWCTNLKAITLAFGYSDLHLLISAFTSHLVNARITAPDCSPFRFVTTLLLELHWQDLSKFLSDFVHAFPSVRRLSMPVTTLDSPDDVEGVRAQNREVFAQKCWPSLDSFSAGGAVPLYALGLPCPVRQWRLEGIRGIFQEWIADIVLLSLKELSIKQLDIDLADTSWDAIRHLLNGLSSQTLPSLNHVRLVTRVDWVAGLSVIEGLLTAIKPAVTNLNLTYIEIQFEVSQLKSDRRWLLQQELQGESTAPQDEGETAYCNIRDLDLRGFASLWFGASSTLQFVVFMFVEEVCGVLNRITAYQRQGGGVVSIGEDAALRLWRTEWETSAGMPVER